MPTVRPVRAHFSSGPCAKAPGMDSRTFANRHPRPQPPLEDRQGAPEGGDRTDPRGAANSRTAHRIGNRSRVRYRRARNGDVDDARCNADAALLAWESFGEGWVTDARQAAQNRSAGDQGRLRPTCPISPPCRGITMSSSPGTAPRRASAFPTANGSPTTARACQYQRCDLAPPFQCRCRGTKLDVTTFSFQKALGGEGGHGVIVLGPRAVERLDELYPRMAAPQDLPPDLEGSRAHRGYLRGGDDQHAFDAGDRGLARCAGVGDEHRRTSGADRAHRRQRRCAGPLGRADALDRTSRGRSGRAFDDERVLDASRRGPGTSEGHCIALLEKEAVAYDIGAYRDAPPGLRIWCGATVDTADIEALTPWLDWAHAEATAAA